MALGGEVMPVVTWPSSGEVRVGFEISWSYSVQTQGTLRSNWFCLEVGNLSDTKGSPKGLNDFS